MFIPAFGSFSTVLAGPLTGEKITEGGTEPDIDVIDMEPEVQVIREETEIADRNCKHPGASCRTDGECCSNQCFGGRGRYCW